MMIIFIMEVKGGFPRLAFKRRHNKRAGKIGAQDGEQEEFALGINLRKLRKAFTQAAFGQQVREERRQTAAHGAQSCQKPADAVLERKAQGRALWIVNVVLFECEDLALIREAGDDADLTPVQADGKRVELFRVKLHHAPPRLGPRGRSRHRGIALRPRRTGL